MVREGGEGEAKEGQGRGNEVLSPLYSPSPPTSSRTLLGIITDKVQQVASLFVSYLPLYPPSPPPSSLFFPNGFIRSFSPNLTSSSISFPLF